MRRFWYFLILFSIITNAYNLSDFLALDAGKDIPASNLPVGWVYVEYPSLFNKDDGTAIVFNSSPCTMIPKLTGTWLKVDAFDGSFFRTEGGMSREFQDRGINQLQQQALVKHRHDHLHSHSHDLVNDGLHDHNHYHPHEHEVSVISGTDGRGFRGSYNYLQGFSMSPSNLNGKTGYYSSLTNDYTDLGRTGEIAMDEIIDETYEPISTPPMTEDNETRPTNYVIRLWQKMDASLQCIEMDYVYDTKYVEVITAIKDESGQIVTTEKNKRIISSSKRVDNNGNLALRIIKQDNTDLPTNGYTLTTEQDSNIVEKIIEFN